MVICMPIFQGNRRHTLWPIPQTKSETLVGLFGHWSTTALLCLRVPSPLGRSWELETPGRARAHSNL